MKRLLAILFTLFFIGMLTDAFALAGHLTRDLKCPRCKMKIEQKNGCPCHKKKNAANPIIHDPCGDDEGDFHISFDRIQAVAARQTPLVYVAEMQYIIHPTDSVSEITNDIPHPPPRV